METKNAFSSDIKAHVIRFLPDEDLYQGIKKYLKENNIKAAFIMTCVGSLKRIHLRLAKKDGEKEGYLKIDDEHYTEDMRFWKSEVNKYEITSLVGCVSVERCHLHIALSDYKGNLIGGHLMDQGNLIYTTAEVVLGVLPQLEFSTFQCEKSGWPELGINNI